MAGWNLKSGVITEYCVSEDKLWTLFNYVFGNSGRKRNTYKFGFIKAILDSLFNGKQDDEGVYFSYYELFSKFAENYWNLVVKYGVRQMRRDGKSEYSKVEQILKDAVRKDSTLSFIEYESIDENHRKLMNKAITNECKKYVVGALYEDFEGALYSFDLKEEGLHLSYVAYEFMLKYKTELERLNYYAWAKFLETINDDNVLIRVIEKLELSTPRRNDLSVYREILKREFEEDTCFYCGKKLKNTIHVDHFIPWTFVKDDKLWNFVLSCPTCNERKNNKVPTKDYLIKLEKRNRIIMTNEEILVVREDFNNYSEDLLSRMWGYAKLSGIKEYNFD